MNICLFSEEELGKPLSVKDERGEHIIKVLHKKEGESFFAGVLNGASGTATITKIADGAIEYTFNPQKIEKTLHPLKMVIGFPRPIQLKRLLRDVAALGVGSVYLTGTALGEKSYMQSNLATTDAAYKMLWEGTVQAASTFVPPLFIYRTLETCVDSLSVEENCLKVALDNVNPTRSLLSAIQEYKMTLETPSFPKNIIAAIGSERGWTNKERIFLENNGFVRCGMGSRIMRTETAATVAASIICAECGWLD